MHFQSQKVPLVYKFAHFFGTEFALALDIHKLQRIMRITKKKKVAILLNETVAHVLIMSWIFQKHLGEATRTLKLTTFRVDYVSNI